MPTLLLPFDGSASARHGMTHVIGASRKDRDLHVHVLHVQSPLPGHVARHVGHAACADFHREQAASILAGAGRSLDAAGVRHALHWEVGDRASCIAEAGRRLRCDRIVFGTTRKSLLVRLVEGSVINRVIALSAVPVEVIPGDAPSRLERFGIPAGVGTGLGALWVAAVD
jgi:nucleotide-binding universal stress UspA family protein